MEKLQQALEKARVTRQNVQSTGKAVQVGPAKELWAALPGYEPQANTLNRSRVSTFAAGSGATPFDVLRTKIVLQMRKNGWKRLAITSPSSGCGKTTTSVNLAIGLSRQPDLRAILFEFDLRRPNMAKMLGTEAGADVTDMLTGEIGFEEQAIRLRDNVAFSIATRRASDPTRYLLANETETRLREIESAYQPDLIMFDLPPILAADDTRAFLSKVDCAIILARAEKTTVAQIDACEREIAEHTNVLGVVLNQCRYADNSTSYSDY